MKKTLLILISILTICYAEAQTISKVRFEPSENTLRLKAIVTPTSGHLLYATPMFGLSPVEIQKINGTWETTAAINPLFAYGIGIGEYSTDAQGNYTVQPYVGLNAFISGGINSNLQGSFQIGGLATFYKWFGFGGGYDVVSHNPFLCTTVKFDISNFSAGAAFTKIKAFK